MLNHQAMGNGLNLQVSGSRPAQYGKRLLGLVQGICSTLLPANDQPAGSVHTAHYTLISFDSLT